MSKLVYEYSFTDYDDKTNYTIDGKRIFGPEEKSGHWWLQTYSQSVPGIDERSIIFRLWYRFQERRSFWPKFAIFSKSGLKSIVYEPEEQIGDETLQHMQWNTGQTKQDLTKRGLLPSRTLTVRIEVFFENPLIRSKQPETILQNKLSSLLKMFEEEKLADFKIIVDGKVINTHKAILASESNVFMAMFESDMKEARDNCLEISDFRYDSIYAMIKFMYCHEVDQMEELAGDLLTLAEKYDIRQLKIYCEHYFYCMLSKDDCLDILQLAESNNAIFLRDQVVKFICETCPEVKKTRRWKQLCHDFADLCKKLSENAKI